jgi:hypothetical protein
MSDLMQALMRTVVEEQIRKTEQELREAEGRRSRLAGELTQKGDEYRKVVAEKAQAEATLRVLRKDLNNLPPI